jgi:molybdopterin-synthase adenylyltransferase
MNPKFSIHNITKNDDGFFDRQERISWWDQQKLRDAKVLVVGAGAIGNETLKNLALLGVGNIYIVDFDTVSRSNLSRAVLFRKTDEGKQKSEVAALRTKDLLLEELSQVSWFHGDAVWELGTGIFREMDIVLGCLDNVETRFFVNRQCWLANTPWIDAGISELGAHVTVFVPPDSPCYQCGASKEQVMASRVRYSCDDFRRTLLEQDKMPTVQITSSLVSALQVQETVKILCGQQVEGGKKIYFQGKINDFDILTLTKKDDCVGHPSYPEIIPVPLTNSITLRDFLTFVSAEELSGINATLDYRGDRTFVLSAECKLCNACINFNKPSFRIFDHEAICLRCARGDDIDIVSKKDGQPSTKKIMYEFNIRSTGEEILCMKLYEIGIPYRHIVAVHNGSNSYKYYELSHDNPFIKA